MIYLIDDTPLQMLGEYLNPSEFSDVLRRAENFSDEDILSLTWASCVLIHSSFHNPKVKRQILSYLDYGNIVPVVLFSDGDSSEAQFSGENFITSIKKRILYSRLPVFLKDFRKAGVANLKLLSGEIAQSTQPTSVSFGSGNVFADFFSQHSINIAVENKEKDSAPRDYFVGRDGMEKLAREVDGEYVRVSVAELKDASNRKQDAKIHDFLAEKFPREIKTLVLDTDADPVLFMRFALHFRLSETLQGNSKYASIVFVSDLSLDKLIKRVGEESQIFRTDGVFLCSRSAIIGQLKTFSGIDKDSFHSGFLDRITISAPQGSHHSIANQWGASRLYMIIKGRAAEKDVFRGFQDIHKDLYFKYVFHRIPPSLPNTPLTSEPFKVKGSSGRRILLIDDEATKGWSKTMSILFPMSRFDVVSEESISEYNDLSEGARQMIESTDYDLILLDLRLGGIEEDYKVNPEEMSGYKVLHAIKDRNRGTQVIILTASNKAWNLKALMRPGCGADGYFVKESPEYEFSDELSIANLRSLISDAERCLQNGYLRDFWRFVQSFTMKEDSLVKEVAAQLSIAYEMAAKAASPKEFQYAYIALYQIVEIVSSRLLDWTVNTDKNKPDTKLLVMNDLTPIRQIVHPTGDEIITRQKPFALQLVPRNAIFPQKDKQAALYLQVWGKQDHGILFIMDQLIAIRNAIIHPDNLEDFPYSVQVRETALQQGKFAEASLVFGGEHFKPLYREAASNGHLFLDSNGCPHLHRGIADTSLGIRFLLQCFHDFLPSIL